MTLLASDIITNALRLVMVLDVEEAATTEQVAQGVTSLNALLLHEFADKSSSWKISRFDYVVPAGTQKITIGPAGDIVANARSIRAVWRSIKSGTVYKTTYELKQKNESEFFQTDVSSQPVNYYFEQQADDTIDLYLWPTPNLATGIRVSVNTRMDAITASTSSINVPSDAEDAVTYLLASRLRGYYGIPIQMVADVEAKAQMYRDQFKVKNRANSYVRLK